MATQYRNPSATAARTIDRAAMDEGLRSYMLRVYNYMALGVALSGAVAFFAVSYQPLFELIHFTPLKWALVIGIIGMGWFVIPKMPTMSTSAAQLTFWIYASLFGAFLSYMAAVYTGTSIVRGFLVTTITFGSMSLYGYTTKRDLSRLGALLSMAAMGLFFALVIHLVSGLVFGAWSPVLHLVFSGLVVLVFTGLTAYDTQRIKREYYAGDDSDVAHRKAIYGAVHLYGNFVIVFIYLMQFLGVARD